MITLQEIHERDKRPPSVTVSMLCYNHEKYLDEAIRGVLMQKTKFPVNIVIHDDASTDRSQEIIRRYASENPNIKAILQEKNLYQNGKKILPFLLPYYTGKYIAYCECDDFWIDEQKLQIQVAYLEAHHDCFAVYGNNITVDQNSHVVDPVNRWKADGDYPRWKISGVEQQIASCVVRNFYQFMTSEELNFYQQIKTCGDQKLMALSLHMGKVHHFSQTFTAYRHVTDEGDSWSARQARLLQNDEYSALKASLIRYTDMHRMIEHFWGRNYYRKYLPVLWCELSIRMKYHRSIIKDTSIPQEYRLKNIPWFIWPTFVVYAPYKAIKKIAQLFLPKKLQTWIRKILYFRI